PDRRRGAGEPGPGDTVGPVLLPGQGGGPGHAHEEERVGDQVAGHRVRAHDRAAAAHRGRQRPDPGLLRPAPPPLSDGDRAATGRLHPGGVRALAGGGTARLSTAAVSQWPPRLTPPYFMRVSDMAAALSSWRSGSYPASTISPMKRVWVPRSSD